MLALELRLKEWQRPQSILLLQMAELTSGDPKVS